MNLESTCAAGQYQVINSLHCVKIPTDYDEQLQQIRLNLMLLTPLFKGSDISTKTGLILVHGSNSGHMPFLPPSVTQMRTSRS